MALFFRRTRTMEELVVILIDDLDRFAAAQKSGEVVADGKPQSFEINETIDGFPFEVEDIARVVNGRESPPPEAPPRFQVEGRIAQIKLFLIGDGEKLPDPTQCQEIAAALLKIRQHDKYPFPLISRLLMTLKDLPFECRKDVALIFSHFFDRDEIFWNEVLKFNQTQTNNNNNGITVEDSNRSISITSSIKFLILEGMQHPQRDHPETDDDDAPESTEPAVASSNDDSNEPSSTSSLKIEYPDMMKMLINGCGSPEVSLNCGVMIRSAIKDVNITARMFKFPQIYVFPFFEATPGSYGGGFLDEMNFDIASDAFATIKDLFTRHKESGLVRDFLLEHYGQLFGEDEASVLATATTTPTPTPPPNGDTGGVAASGGGDGGGNVMAPLIGLYGGLLSQSRNFFTRRQSLKLLAELLLDRANFNIMMKFIGNKHNLKLVMNLLIDSSKNIQFEAFHVFKVFVANPRKPPEIVTALVRNKERLLKYLEGFHNDRQDPQFIEEKNLIIQTLSAIEPVPTS